MNYTRYQCPICGEEISKELNAMAGHSQMHFYHGVHAFHAEPYLYDSALF